MPITERSAKNYTELEPSDDGIVRVVSQKSVC